MAYLLTIPCRLVLTIFGTALSPIFAIFLAIFETELAQQYPKTVEKWLTEVWA